LVLLPNREFVFIDPARSNHAVYSSFFVSMRDRVNLLIQAGTLKSKRNLFSDKFHLVKPVNDNTMRVICHLCAGVLFD